MTPEKTTEIQAKLPIWLAKRLEELEKTTGLTRDEILVNALASQIFPKQPARRTVGRIAAALLAICLLAAPVRAQTEQTDPPLDLKLKPPIVTIGDGADTQPLVVRASDSTKEPMRAISNTPGVLTIGNGAAGTIITAAPVVVSPAPATIAPKKPNAFLRKCRFLCNFIAPFVNLGAAIKNFFN